MNPQQIVAATLRQIAHWADDEREPEALCDLAREVEHEDYARALCCPMCQELDCDEDCPLLGVRS